MSWGALYFYYKCPNCGKLFKYATDLFGTLIAAGAMAHMMIQVILNIAVVTNTIPNTGITLPFVSYGGTSVVFLLIEMGVVLNVSSLLE